jgi:hypothetical protein
MGHRGPTRPVRHGGFLRARGRQCAVRNPPAVQATAKKKPNPGLSVGWRALPSVWGSDDIRDGSAYRVIRIAGEDGLERVSVVLLPRPKPSPVLETRWRRFSA